ncbi:putative RING-H2 finger protein ATL13 [Sesbania bispinosa]|nr:putative RING-H2 finger protein ATL13 [Sesbania bispinosa]
MFKNELSARVTICFDIDFNFRLEVEKLPYLKNLLQVGNYTWESICSRVDLASSENPDPNMAGDGVEKVVTVKLGKYRNVDGGFEEGSSTNNVPIRTPMKQQSSKKRSVLPLTPGHRPAMSECDCESKIDFKFVGFYTTRGVEDLTGTSSTGNGSGAAIGRSRMKSFSISKIWLMGKKDKSNSVANSSRRAISFRFLAQRIVVGDSATDDFKDKNGKFDTRRHMIDGMN